MQRKVGSRGGVLPSFLHVLYKIDQHREDACLDEGQNNQPLHPHPLLCLPPTQRHTWYHLTSDLTGILSLDDISILICIQQNVQSYERQASSIFRFSVLSPPPPPRRLKGIRRWRTTCVPYVPNKAKLDMLECGMDRIPTPLQS